MKKLSVPALIAVSLLVAMLFPATVMAQKPTPDPGFESWLNDCVNYFRFNYNHTFVIAAGKGFHVPESWAGGTVNISFIPPTDTKLKGVFCTWKDEIVPDGERAPYGNVTLQAGWVVGDETQTVYIVWYPDGFPTATPTTTPTPTRVPTHTPEPTYTDRPPTATPSPRPTLVYPTTTPDAYDEGWFDPDLKKSAPASYYAHIVGVIVFVLAGIAIAVLLIWFIIPFGKRLAAYFRDRRDPPEDLR